MELTFAQSETLKDVLTEWIDNEIEVLNDAFNYGMSRSEFVARYTRTLNTAVILENVFGVNGCISKTALSPEELNDQLEVLN